MTAQLLFLVLPSAALLVALVALVPGWRWRRAAARPAVPGSGALGRLATVVDGSIRMSVVRTLRRDATWSREPGIHDVNPRDIDAVVAGRPRTVRPTRLVVSGLKRPQVTGSAAVATRADPRARLLHDMVVVVGLGAAVIVMSTLLPRSPDLESAVLGATGEPAPLRPPPAAAAPLPEATPTAQPSQDPSQAPSTGPEASPSPAPSATAGATTVSTPSPDTIPTRTQRSNATARPTSRPSASAGASPSPSSSASPSDSTLPSDSPWPSGSPSPAASPSDPPSPSAAASPSPVPTPTPSPSTEPDPSIEPSPAP